MNVLVTGHLGYIGSVLADFVRIAGHRVTGLDNRLFADCLLGDPGSAIPCMDRDLRDVVRADLEGFDAVIHLAGLCNDPLSDLNPALTWAINYEASLRVAELAKAAGVSRFLLASSCSMYGASGDGLVDETAPLRPITVYAKAKVELENALRSLADDRFSPTYLRNATAYGWSPRIRLDLVLNDLAASALTTGRVLMKSDGTPWRPIVHIEDIARAFVAALSAPRESIHDAAFNVGVTEHNYQMRELAECVQREVAGSRIEYAQGAGPDTRCYRVDFSKIKAALPEFQPQWNPAKGAQELIERFRQYDLTASESQGPRFRRLDWIRKLQREGLLTDGLRETKCEPALCRPA